jgi:Transposase, Mutator family
MKIWRVAHLSVSPQRSRPQGRAADHLGRLPRADWKRLPRVFPQTDWQRCVVHFYRNVFSHVPNGKVADVARMLKAIDAQEHRRAAQVEQKVGETMTYYAYPSTHWRQIRTNNPLERLIREPSGIAPKNAYTDPKACPFHERNSSDDTN